MDPFPGNNSDSRNDRLIESRRRLTTSSGKLERISQHTKGLLDEITGWVDLRVKLVQVELQEQFETKKIQIALGAGMGLLAFFSLMFVLTALALGIGSWLGHPAWGFLSVAVLLIIIVAILYAVMKRMVRSVSTKVSVDEERLASQMHTSGDAGNKNE